jgi:alpha-tubulin suppressor-like RCC1 family protein
MPGDAPGMLGIQVKSGTVLCGAANGVPLSGKGVNGVVELAAGTRHNCARRSDGTVACWGNDMAGQLGNGQFKKQDLAFNFAAPQEVWLPAAATSIGAGFMFTCATLVPPHGVACWGFNAGAQTGQPPSYAQLEAGIVYDPDKPDAAWVVTGKQIAGSDNTACMRDIAGSIWCWGDNQGITTAQGMLTGQGAALFGQDPNAPIFNGQTFTPYPTQVPVPAPVGASTDLVVNDYKACVTLGSGVQCWSQLVIDNNGNASDASVYTPQPVLDSDGGAVRSVKLGAGDGHVCAIQSSGTILCWGANSAGQLGNGSTNDAVKAVPVTGITDAISVTGSGNHTCAVRRNGKVMCWGDNALGQLGDGTTTPSPVPVEVKLTEPASSLGSCSVGLCAWTCAITQGGHVWCWGANNYLQLGQSDGGGGSQSSVPLRVQGF